MWLKAAVVVVEAATEMVKMVMKEMVAALPAAIYVLNHSSPAMSSSHHQPVDDKTPQSPPDGTTPSPDTEDDGDTALDTDGWRRWRRR